MSKVAFNESVVRNNKRKRVNGNDSSRRPEMKQWNPFFPESSESSLSYNAIQIANCYSPSGSPQGGFGAWTILPLSKPTDSFRAGGKIGKEIFLRYLRFKGYIEVKFYPQYKMHYRLKLIRSENVELTNLTHYFNLYKNTEAPNSNDINASYVALRHDFFKMVRNVGTKTNVKVTTICSGVLGSHLATQTCTLAAGSTSTYGFQSTTPMVTYGGNECIPIDVKVTCNDRLTTNIFYYIILETDFPIGLYYDNTTGTSHDSVTPSKAWNFCPFLFNFFCTGYFTDD